MTASQSNINAVEFTRFKQRVTTVGVAVEFDASVRAIYVGPQSDYHQYRVLYFDPSNQLEVVLAVITAERPFVNQLNADVVNQPPDLVRRSSAGTLLNKTAKIIVVPDDDFDQQAILDLANGTQLINPNLDLIGVNGARPFQVIEGRADFSLDVALSLPANGVSPTKLWFIPIYGRRSISFQTFRAGNIIPDADITFAIQGHRVANGNQVVGTTLLSSTNAGLGLSFFYTADTSGEFDFVSLNLTSAVAFAGNDPEDFDSGGYRLLFRASDE